MPSDRLSRYIASPSKEFVFYEKNIQRAFPHVARAPPKLQFEKYDPNDNETAYSLFSENQAEDINQVREWNEDDYNQDLSW